MDYNFSTRMQGVDGSVIGGVLKLMADPSIISFGGGNPASESFPTADIASIAAEVLEQQPDAVLQYGLTEGYPPLREALKQYLAATEGISFADNELFIVSGGQQASDLVTKVLVNEGDVVLTEDPAFVGCLNTFRSYGARLAGVPMEPDGMDLDALEQAMKANPDAKLLYTIPNFQNPTGYTTSGPKRKAIYELACKYNVIIFEDNPYGALRFEGDPVPTIKSMDTEGRVVYAGSFSKTMAPAFRLSGMVFGKGMAGQIAAAKQCADVHSNVLFQHICYKYMTACDYAAHIQENCTIYKKKALRMLDAMEQHFHPAVRYIRPQGGMFVMSFLPDGMDAYPFVAEGIKRGVATIPGAAFAADASKPSNGFRMNYSTPTDSQIDRGVEILGKLTHEWLKK